LHTTLNHHQAHLQPKDGNSNNIKVKEDTLEDQPQTNNPGSSSQKSVATWVTKAYFVF